MDWSLFENQYGDDLIDAVYDLGEGDLAYIIDVLIRVNDMFSYRISGRLEGRLYKLGCDAIFQTEAVAVRMFGEEGKASAMPEIMAHAIEFLAEADELAISYIGDRLDEWLEHLENEGAEALLDDSGLAISASAENVVMSRVVDFVRCAHSKDFFSGELPLSASSETRLPIHVRCPDEETLWFSVDLGRVHSNDSTAKDSVSKYLTRRKKAARAPQNKHGSYEYRWDYLGVDPVSGMLSYAVTLDENALLATLDAALEEAREFIAEHFTELTETLALAGQDIADEETRIDRDVVAKSSLRRASKAIADLCKALGPTPTTLHLLGTETKAMLFDAMCAVEEAVEDAHGEEYTSAEVMSAVDRACSLLEREGTIPQKLCRRASMQVKLEFTRCHGWPIDAAFAEASPVTKEKLKVTVKNAVLCEAGGFKPICNGIALSGTLGNDDKFRPVRIVCEDIDRPWFIIELGSVWPNTPEMIAAADELFTSSDGGKERDPRWDRLFMDPLSGNFFYSESLERNATLEDLDAKLNTAWDFIEKHASIS